MRGRYGRRRKGLRDWYVIAAQPAPAPHLAHPEGFAALHMVLITMPRVCRSCEHFPNGLDLEGKIRNAQDGIEAAEKKVVGSSCCPIIQHLWGLGVAPSCMGQHLWGLGVGPSSMEVFTLFRCVFF